MYAYGFKYDIHSMHIYIYIYRWYVCFSKVFSHFNSWEDL